MKFNVAMVRSGLQDRLETLEQLKDSGEYIVENVNTFKIIKSRLEENGSILVPITRHEFYENFLAHNSNYLRSWKTCQLIVDMGAIQDFLDKLYYIDLNESQIDEKEIPSRVREILTRGVNRESYITKESCEKRIESDLEETQQVSYVWTSDEYSSMYYKKIEVGSKKDQEILPCTIIETDTPQGNCSKVGLIAFCTGVVLAVLGLLMLA